MLRFPERFSTGIFVKCPPSLDRDHFEKLFGCTIQYESEYDQIELNPELLDVKLPGANSQINRLNEEMLNEHLSRLKDQDIGIKVRAVIVSFMSKGHLVGVNVASEIHMSVRKVSRKLREVGITFSQLAYSIRHEKAISFIKQPNVCFG